MHLDKGARIAEDPDPWTWYGSGRATDWLVIPALLRLLGRLACTRSERVTQLSDHLAYEAFVAGRASPSMELLSCTVV